MAIEREAVVEAALVAAGVVVFIAVVVVGGTFGGSDHLGSQGALTVVGGIVAFLFVMTGIGFYLASQD